MRRTYRPAFLLVSLSILLQSVCILHAAEANVTPSQISFGTQRLGSISKSKTIKIHGLLSSDWTPLVEGDFAPTGSSCSVATNSVMTCDLEIVFIPRNVGARSGSVTFQFGDGTPSKFVPVAGTGVDTKSPLISIAVTPTTADVAIGKTQQFTAIGTYENGETADLTSFALWSSVAPEVASIVAVTGLATPLTVGSTTIVASFAGLTGTAGVSVYVPGFSPTGRMALGRWKHTATKLNDGRVLVTGGFGLQGVLATAELYDPNTGTFSGVGNMNLERLDHAASLLLNGKVLITGGASTFGLAAAAELFDPVTGAFTIAGAMHTPRYRHTATALHDGRVLIAGGETASGSGLAVIPEIYDPATGLLTQLGPMTTTRIVHTAILLPNGKVLIAGGRISGQDDSTASAELFDPATNTFTPTGAMTRPRHRHSVALLNDGRVLLAGGESQLGGIFNGTWELVAPTDLYDPVSGTFTASGALAIPRFSHAAVRLPDGQVMVVGGSGQTNISGSEIFNPITGTFAPGASMSITRQFHTATLLDNGRVLITGGFDGHTPSWEAELYRP